MTISTVGAIAAADVPKDKINTVNLRAPITVPVTIPKILETQFYVVNEQAPGPQF